MRSGNPILRAFGYWFLLALLVLAILSFVGSVYQDVPDISWYWRLALLRNARGFAVPICRGSIRKLFYNTRSLLQAFGPKVAPF